MLRNLLHRVFNLRLLVLLASLAYDQSQAAAQADTLQPKTVALQASVMVIPFVREGDNMREVYEHQHGGPIRAAITRVKDGLDQKGIKTIDFRAVLRQLKNKEAMSTDQQSSLKEKVIALSSADIYVESETQVIRTPKGNSVTVILTAYDAFTGLSLVNKLGHSPKFYTENYEKLAEKALNTFLDEFTEELQETFEDMMQNGRLIALDIGIAENADIDMDSEVGGSEDLLSDVLEDWLEENAFQSHFHIQGITATRMIVDQLKIPARDLETNKNYRPSKFATRLRKFLISQGFEVTRDIQGTKIFITIGQE